MNFISSLDILVITVYLAVIFFIAFKASKFKTSDTTEDQYLAGKSLTIAESLFSIIATEVSALTFLGIPAFAYGSDFSFIQIYFGAIVGRVLIAKLFLPKIYDKGLTVYSVMGKAGTKSGQRFTAIFYLINKILAVGVRLFSGSILIAQFFQVHILTAIFIICVLTFIYTLIGGLKAVVRTDMMQMFLFIFGGIIAHFMIADVSENTWTQLMVSAFDANKMNFIDFTNLTPFITGVIGGVLFDMATHGVDQDFVQRLTANKSMKGAQIAIISSSFLSILVALLFLSIGSLLWAHYQIQVPPNVNNDQLFAYFITNHFPDGLKGLMVAGVLAATMSTLDSSINALSASFFSDIRSSSVSEKSSYKMDTLIITLLLMIVAFVASRSDGLLLLGLKITSWTAGSLVALFFASVIWRKWMRVSLDTFSVLGTYALGIGAVYLNTNVFKLPWQWNVYFAFSIGIIFLKVKGKLLDQK